MAFHLNGQIQALAEGHRRRGAWRKAVAAMGCAVVFCVASRLMLPAVTLTAGEALDCPCTVHQHDSSCRDGDGKLICGLADYVVHTHDRESCYDSDGTLVCPLPEVETHRHEGSCYREESVLDCGLEESVGHVHTQDCYPSAQEEPVCGNTDPEHAHSEVCDTQEPTCGMTPGQGAHKHSDECYKTEKLLTCEKSEVILHTHSEEAGCYETVRDETGEVVGKRLICGQLQVEEHRHTQDCVKQKEADTGEMTPDEKVPSEKTSDEEDVGKKTTGEEGSKEENLSGENSVEGSLAGDGAAALTPEQTVEAQIDALPTPEALGEARASLDLDGREAYLAEVTDRAEAAFEAYNALTEEQRFAVSNAHALPELLSALAVEDVILRIDRLPDLETVQKMLIPQSQEEVPSSASSFPEDGKVEKTDSLTNANSVDNALTENQGDSSGGQGDAQAQESVQTQEVERSKEGTTTEKGVSAGEEQPVGKDTTGENDATGENATGQETGDASLEEVRAQITGTFQMYDALTGEQKEKVTNAQTLLTLMEALEQVTEENSGPATQTGGFRGYVKDVSIEKVEDGIAPFDSDNSDGNDADNNNRIVRSFDTIKYELIATMGKRDTVSESPSEVLCFEIDMYKKISEATFDLSTMGWLQDGNATWEIQYIANVDGEEKAVMIQDQYGVLRYDSNEDGVIDSGDETTSFNALLSGSTDANSAYEMVGGSIVKQRLVGEKAYSNEGSAFAGRQTLTTGIQVRNAENGDTFEPSIRAYFKRNPENWGPLQDDGAGNLTSERESENEITLNNDYKNGAYKVTVSAAPLFNLMLEDTSEYVNLLSWFDFGAGQEVTDSKLLAYLTAAGSLVENWDKVNPDAYTNHAADENVASLYNALSDAQKGSLSNIRYGRMNGLGITLSLAASNTAGKGLMGCSLPVGDISFDLDLAVKTTVVDEGATPDTSGYSAILWDYRPNVRTDTYYYEDDGHIRQGFTNLDRGLSSRNMYWENIDFSREASHVAPRAYRGSGTFDAAVYDSGYWSLTGVNGGSGTNSSAGDVEDGHSTYTFQINDYDFDFDGFDSDGFPDRFYGEGAPNTRAGLRVTDYAFFGGYAQVLYVMPYAQSATVTIQKDVTVGNLTLTTKGDTSNLALAEGASQGGTVKTTNEADPYDNHTANALTLYSVGQFTSRSSFNTADATNHTMGDSGKSFLGTNFWSGPSWDENIFAGTDISIIGSAQLSTGSDNHVRAVNLLQLFDSKALSITPLGGITGSETADSCLLQSEVGFGNFYENTYGGHNPQVTYLFAADPAYTGGYDTNVDGIVAHMNLVRENNLVYSDKLYWNEEAGCYNIVKFDIDRDGNLEELTCVGVMAEVRNCNFKDYVYIRIPVTVADDESCVNTTVCTLNTATAWIDAGAMLDENGNNISWLNGQWANGTNTLAGYQTIQSAAQSGGNGYEKHNSNENAFVKVEYDDNGHYQTGVGGPAEGNTLLILGYKANVDVIDQKYRDDSSANFYSPGEGDDTVTWVVQGIETEISTDPTPQQGITTLTIPVTLAHTEGTATGTASELFPIENGTYTITVQNYQTDENGNAILNEAGELIPTDTSTYPISTDPDSPTEITFLGTYSEYNAQTGSYVTKKRLYTYKIYAVENSANDGVTFQLSDVPVGQKLPDITFQMFLSSVLGNSDKITATAAVSGAADKRAYSSTSGNMAQRTININNNTKTSLVKRVDKERGEMGTDIQYKVTFSNSGTNSINTAYFYDNLPYDGDNRGTSYTSVDTDSTVMKAVELKSNNLGTTVDTGDFQANVTIYFSTLNDFTLNELLTGFNGTTSTTDEANQDKIEEMLANTDYFQPLIRSEPVYEASDAGTFYQLKPTVEGAAGTYTSTPPTAETLNDYVLKEGIDEAQRYLKHAFFRRTYAETQRWITGYGTTDNYLDEDKPVYASDTFNVTVGGKTVACNGGEEAYRTFLSSVTGIFVKMTNLGPSRDVVLTIDMGTNTNKAGDVYANRAYNWNGAGVPIQTTIVSTKIYSRAISGLVWVDENLNGVYDEGETLLNGVTCTLFMWDDMQQKYVPCTTDVKGEAIAPIVTGSYNYQYHTIGGEASLTVRAWKDADNGSLYRDEHGHVVTLTEDEMAASQSDGTYHFGGLSQGKYIVAFSGGDLEKYGGATSYQVMGGSTDANNDGVALTATANSNLDTEVSAIAGIGKEYKYVIAFDLTSSEGTNQAKGVTLKALSEISEETCMDSYDHQDLGLVVYAAGFELPETGGGGGALYWTGGVLLMMAAALLLLYSHRKRGKEDIASS